MGLSGFETGEARRAYPVGSYIYPLHQVISQNPPVREVSGVAWPRIHPEAVVGAHAMVIGDVCVDRGAFLGFYSVIRADSAYPFYIGPYTNLQDYVLMHCHPGDYLEVGGRRMGVVIEGEVSVLHHAAVHGPLFVGRNTFIGQHVSVYDAWIGRDCVIMHGAVITNRVRIPNGRLVEAGRLSLCRLLPDVADDPHRLPHAARAGARAVHDQPRAARAHPPGGRLCMGVEALDPARLRLQVPAFGICQDPGGAFFGEFSC
ncbi:MAG: hypothetical protein K6T30_05825 [Alicyclobacillus sp.]|nr:hypothetical protein [Alicyclobacillus sp.]